MKNFLIQYNNYVIIVTVILIKLLIVNNFNKTIFINMNIEKPAHRCCPRRRHGYELLQYG